MIAIVLWPRASETSSSGTCGRGSGPGSRERAVRDRATSPAGPDALRSSATRKDSRSFSRPRVLLCRPPRPAESSSNVVPKVRFELTRGFPQRILSPPRLPVPPLRPVQQGIAPAGPPKPRLRSPRPDTERRTSPAGSDPISDSWHPRAQPGRATESGPGPTIEDDGELEATSGFEPLNRGFADLPLNHLGTSPRRSWPEGVRPDVRSTAERYGSLPLEDSNLG